MVGRQGFWHNCRAMQRLSSTATESVQTESGQLPTPDPKPQTPAAQPEEFGGPAGPEPTRYGDWEKKGRCVDF